MRRLGFLGIVLILEVLAPGCSLTVRSRSGPKLPPLRTQVVDHINAYIRSITCSTKEWNCFSVLRVGERADHRDPACQAPFNAVSDLAYVAPQVDAIVYGTMRDNLEDGLKLRRSMLALWMLALGPGPSDCDPRVEKKLRSLFWKATPLSGTLLEAAGERIGCPDCRSRPCKTRASRRKIRLLLDGLRQGHRTWTGLWRGIPAFRGQPGTDPVLAVAVARSAAAIEDVPSMEAVEQELEAMGCAVRP